VIVNGVQILIVIGARVLLLRHGRVGAGDGVDLDRAGNRRDRAGDGDIAGARRAAGLTLIRMRPATAGRYLPLMFTTHALTTTVQTPVARGSLQSIRLRFRRPALVRAAF
jgi:hypothetical protein